MDRNYIIKITEIWGAVALRKESVDRNREQFKYVVQCRKSLSARRAWIEMLESKQIDPSVMVALRKESVDRNQGVHYDNYNLHWSLSARRAWIEISYAHCSQCPD